MRRPGLLDGLLAAVVAVPLGAGVELDEAAAPARLGADAVAAALEAVAEAATANRAGRAEAAAAGMATAQARLAAAQAEGAGLAGAVRGMEAALAALRDGIAGAGEEVRLLERALRQEEADIKRLVAVLATARPGRTVPRAHPGGPVAAARAALLLERVEAGLQAEADALAGRMTALAAARQLRQDGEERLAAGLGALAAARTELRQALAVPARPAGPPDPEAATALVARDSETLTDLAAALAGRPPAVPAPAPEPAEPTVVANDPAVQDDGVQVTRSSRSLAEPGALKLAAPVAGWVLRGFRDPDGGGVRRPGLTLAAAPRSVVTAPAAGEVRYAGPFLDYNRVVVLAPEPGTVVVLAGLAELAVEEGMLVAAGAPLGFLGGRELDAQEFLMLPGKGSDALGAETLYMELWRAGSPVDPGPWLDAQNG